MGKKIFLIEDELLVREMYERVLARAGYGVESAIDGQEALDKLAETSDYDLILLDIMLPKVSGLDVLKRIKSPESPTKSIPVYLLTNLGQDSVIKEAFSIGAEGYLIKSALLPKQVVQEVDNFFASRGSRGEGRRNFGGGELG